MSPELRRAAGGNQGETELVLMPGTVPVLVPGQEWRTFWDTTIARHDAELPARYEATVRFKDSRGKAFEFKSILDWGVTMQRQVITTYGLHQAAQALRDMSKTLDRWKEGAGGGLKVYVRDGDAKDAKTREWIEQQRREREAAHANVRASASARSSAARTISAAASNAIASSVPGCRSSSPSSPTMRCCCCAPSVPWAARRSSTMPASRSRRSAARTNGSGARSPSSLDRPGDRRERQAGAARVPALRFDVEVTPPPEGPR